MQEVLNTLERHTVCTGTQCFESEEDAFGITTTPNGTPSNSTNFFMFMMSLHTYVVSRCNSRQGAPPSVPFPKDPQDVLKSQPESTSVKRYGSDKLHGDGGEECSTTTTEAAGPACAMV